MQRRAILALGLAALIAGCSPASQKEATQPGRTAMKLATDWRAQAELGGYYQALATGEYQKRGLDVTLIQGGPAVNVPQLLAAGAVDVGVGSNSFIALNLAKENAPVKAVAAFMQKDPQVLIAHPGQGVNGFADMKGRPILLSDASITAFWVWLRSKYGFTDDQVRKYNYSSAPFLADKRVIQQGYATSEPYLIEKESGIKPAVFLLADSGYPAYASFALVPDSLIAKNPAAVQAFVEATAAGWKSYLYGDAKPGDAAILKDNPEMTQDVLDQAREKMRSYGIVGKDGEIGQMTDARWAELFKVTSEAGVYPADMDYRKAYTLQFLPKGQ
ncbi:ABC transporter substrate-binding protein [Caulobacter sp. RHG1]|uniref:ABC transporter substrate-binding protein n=1 Tax=Caulobacter sp. (strain RHG1) TaxID=2545762 RepID=UPI001554E7A3|nr:ABC transporter substrate-binding protein [Caulobacter sp. RHG1]NQE64381.1 Hydroxymethylpyrimidine ABC transporter, substrate-binding component [Caulobacter sp. RHG1]